MESLVAAQCIRDGDNETLTRVLGAPQVSRHSVFRSLQLAVRSNHPPSVQAILDLLRLKSDSLPPVMLAVEAAVQGSVDVVNTLVQWEDDCHERFDMSQAGRTDAVGALGTGVGNLAAVRIILYWRSARGKRFFDASSLRFLDAVIPTSRLEFIHELLRWRGPSNERVNVQLLLALAAKHHRQDAVTFVKQVQQWTPQRATWVHAATRAAALCVASSHRKRPCVRKLEP